MEMERGTSVLSLPSWDVNRISLPSCLGQSTMSGDMELGLSVLLSCKSPHIHIHGGANVSVAGGGIGGIIASVSFRQQDRATGYIPGLWTTVAAQIVICITASLLMLYFRSQNKKADRGEKVLAGHVGELSR